MRNTCGDKRFEVIAKAKEHLLESTNIETSEDEMKVLDSFLFRCWQMGWLARYDDDVTAVNKCTIDTYLKGLHDFETFLGMVAQMRKAQDLASMATTETDDYMKYINESVMWEKEVDSFLEKQGL